MRSQILRSAVRARRAAPVAVAVSAALAIGLLTPPATATPTALVVSAPAATAATVTGRPDYVTAQMAAQELGSRVEVVDERSESRRVWANPDGTFTAEVFAGPNWVQDESGEWREIDTTLRRDTAGDVVPRAAAVDVTLAGDAAASPTGDAVNEVAQVAIPKSSLDELADAQADPTVQVPATTDAGTSAATVAIGTEGALPAPTLAGNEATYADVAPDQDLRIRVLPTGVQTFVDIKARPTDLAPEGLQVALPL